MRVLGFARLARAISLAGFGLFVLVGASAGAAEVNVSDLTIVAAWARATPVKTGAAYITVRNDGDAADRLTGVSAEIAQMTHLHLSKEENGVMQMRPVDAIDIPPHATVTLKPGAYHVMLMGLVQPLKAGDTFPLALKFEKAGAVIVTVTVKPVGAAGDGMGDMK